MLNTVNIVHKHMKNCTSTENSLENRFPLLVSYVSVLASAEQWKVRVTPKMSQKLENINFYLRCFEKLLKKDCMTIIK